MLAALNKLIDPLRRRVRLMIGRAVLAAAADDSKGIQLVQVKLLDGEVGDGVERMQNYGYTSVPKTGAEGLMACVSGDRNHGIVVVMDDRRFRLKNLQPGEVAMYTDEGDTIIFKRGRKIEVTAGAEIKATAPNVNVVASVKVALTTPLVEASGNLNVGGAITAQGDVTGGGISLMHHKTTLVTPGGGLSGEPQ
ncbi:MAG: phage baseplate assembly protein V [Pseudomonadota bacterium]